VTILEKFKKEKEPSICNWWNRLSFDNRFYKNDIPIIYEFFEDYRFLSNFHIQQIVYDGAVYTSTEAAYQASKTNIPEIKEQIRLSSPSSARKMGQAVTLRKNWENVKEQIMREVVTLKFEASCELTMKLLETGEAYLVEGNIWHDNFYGICIKKNCPTCQDKIGKNILGKILMEIRYNIRQNIRQNVNKFDCLRQLI
jgi:ribA/ribD-fused uncharacterized protein